MPNKPYALLTTARSGSTPVYEILKSYLSQNYGIQGAHSIMNPRFGTYEIVEKKLVMDPSRNNPNETYEKRAELVQKFHGQIFFKIYPDEFKGDFGHWLFDNYNFVTIERHDLVEQVLSFLISAQTQIWYRPEGINLKPGSLEAKRSYFSHIEGSLYVLHHLKKSLKVEKCLFYEDFINDPPGTFLVKNGFDKSFDSSHLKLPPKQNKGDKGLVFSNMAEIEAWYRNSWLSDVCPWNR